MSDETKHIEVTLAEAITVGTHLRIEARRSQCAADQFHRAGCHAESARLKRTAALLDDFADKLFRTFVGEDGVADSAAFVDEFMKRQIL